MKDGNLGKKDEKQMNQKIFLQTYIQERRKISSKADETTEIICKGQLQ